MIDVQEVDLEDVWRTLERERSLDSIAALTRAAFGGDVGPHNADQERVAVGLDTNAVLRLADKSRTDVVDFLGSLGDAPLILPGQVVQEFWNNTLAVIETHGESVRKKYLALTDDVKRLGVEFGDFSDRFLTVLAEFAEEYAFALDPQTGSRLKTVLDTLEKRATTPYVPRARFYALAEARDKTRTPPGFKDVGQHGDFYVWADFLLGLAVAHRRNQPFDLAVLVTEDAKGDWSRGGRAHPILVAEVQSLVGVPFEIWDLATLTQFAGTKTSALLALPEPPQEAAL
jgi:hypothetical protein